MLSRFSLVGVISLILMAALLIFCLPGSAAYAGDGDGGGGGGEWPDDIPPAPGGGGDGSSIIVTIATILGVIL